MEYEHEFRYPLPNINWNYVSNCNANISLIKETNITNFGHTKLLWKQKNDEKFYWDNEKTFKNEYIEQQISKNNFELVNNPQKYLELHKYILLIGKDEKKTVQANNEPTLVMSLFAPLEMLYYYVFNYDYTAWITKYIHNQIRLILSFKLKFPKGNTRIYIDKFLVDMLETHKIDFYFRNIKFVNLENASKSHHDDMEKYFRQFEIIMLEELKVKLFPTSFHELLFFYTLASESNKNETTGNINFNSNSIEIFVYEFKGIFVEHSEYNNKFVPHTNPEMFVFKSAHTNSYIGQHMRFIALSQKNYQHKGQNISRPRHIIFRDGHTNTIGQYDFQYINALNKQSQEKKLKMGLVPTNIFYSSGHMDYLKSKNECVKIAPIAGEIQFCNFTNSDYFFTDNEIIKICGLPFILNTNESTIKLFEFLKNRYVYGIDEYILTTLYADDVFKKYCVYNQSIWLLNLLSSNWKTYHYGDNKYINLMRVALGIVGYILIQAKRIDKSETNWYVIMRIIEDIRWSDKLKKLIDESQIYTKINNFITTNNDTLLDFFKLLLTIIPNIYHIRDFVFITNIHIPYYMDIMVEDYITSIDTNMPKYIANMIKNIDKLFGPTTLSTEPNIRYKYTFQEHSRGTDMYGLYDEIITNNITPICPNDLLHIIR